MTKRLLFLALFLSASAVQAQVTQDLTFRKGMQVLLKVEVAGYDFSGADVVRFRLLPFVGRDANTLVDITCSDSEVSCLSGEVMFNLHANSSYASLEASEYYYQIDVEAGGAPGPDSWYAGTFEISKTGAPGTNPVTLIATINTGGTTLHATLSAPGIGGFAGSGTTGLVPDPGTENGYYLQDDGTWSQVSSTDDQNASEVAVTPAGGISSTDVQNALEELDTEKAPTGHNHAAGDINSGVLAHERGGLEVDLSAYNGLIRIASGTTTNITNLAGLNTALGSSIADGAHTVDTKLTQEEVQDFVGSMSSGGTQTRITFTYNDATNKFDLVVDDMNQGPTVDCTGNDVQRADATCVDLDNDDSTVNEASDPVHWSRIKGMPAGFADGTDDGGGGSSVALDLADDDTNESAGISEIAITGDTNGIFSEPSADKLLVNVGLNWPSADIADAVSNADYGDITITGGVWSIDANVVGPPEIDLTANYPWTGGHDFGCDHEAILFDRSGALDCATGDSLKWDAGELEVKGKLLVNKTAPGPYGYDIYAEDIEVSRVALASNTEIFYASNLIRFYRGANIFDISTTGIEVHGTAEVADDITFEKCEYTASASTITVDATDCPASEALLDEASITISLTNAAAATRVGSIRIKVLQDATGNRDPSWTGVNWAGGTEPTWSTGANDFDIVGCDVIDGNFYCYLAAGGF